MIRRLEHQLIRGQAEKFGAVHPGEGKVTWRLFDTPPVSGKPERDPQSGNVVTRQGTMNKNFLQKGNLG